MNTNHSTTAGEEEEGAAGGGFLNPTLPSPAPTTSNTSATTTSITLPRQRNHPLKPGGAKESSLISHVDRKILRINRRHAKKFSSALGGDGDADSVAEKMDDEEEDAESEAKGYENFKEVVRDIEEVIDVVWVSGTPSLQIPYLISLAGLVNTYLPDYPSGRAAAKATFGLLRKFDVMFASLLVGEDVESGMPLSGFEAGRGATGLVSMTEKVRIKSVAETSRIVVVGMEVGGDVDDEDENEEEEGDGMDVDGDGDGDETGTWEMQAARVYERTIQYLGDELGRAELG